MQINEKWEEPGDEKWEEPGRNGVMVDGREEVRWSTVALAGFVGGVAEQLME